MNSTTVVFEPSFLLLVIVGVVLAFLIRRRRSSSLASPSSVLLVCLTFVVLPFALMFAKTTSMERHGGEERHAEISVQHQDAQASRLVPQTDVSNPIEDVTAESLPELEIFVEWNAPKNQESAVAAVELTRVSWLRLVVFSTVLAMIYFAVVTVTNRYDASTAP